MFHFGHGMSVRSRTHTGFVREETTGHTELHSFGHGQAQGAAANSFGIKGSRENQLKGRNNLVVMSHEHKGAAYDIDTGHKGHDLFSNASQATHTTEKDQAGNNRNTNAGGQEGNSKGFVEGVRDSVGLYKRDRFIALQPMIWHGSGQEHSALT